MKIRFIQMPFHGERNVAERSSAPRYVDDRSLREMGRGEAIEILPSVVAELSREEDSEYGRWHRLGLANRHLADHVAGTIREDALPIGLLANCNALMGMLAGLQRAESQSTPRRVGLIWIDAHADFNTPETTLSGMLGGMPVATSAGLCLHQLRETSGMMQPIHAEHIIMCGLRDVDPEERALLDEHGVREVSLDDLRTCQSAAPAEVRQLLDAVDVIYVHVDMDVLDPQEVSGHPLTVPEGPSSRELAESLASLFGQPKIAALGIASTPTEDRDEDGLAKAAAHRLITAAASSR